MPKLTNTSARQVTVAITKKVKTMDKQTGHNVDSKAVSHRIILKPGILTTVSVADWKQMLNIYLIKKMLDNGELLEGQAASRESVDNEVVEEELKKDLTDNELEVMTA